MGKSSISFIILALFLGLFLGAVLGSLLSHIFGLSFLDQPVFGRPIRVAEDFYIIKKLELQITPASLLGLVITGWLLYKKEKEKV